MKKLLFIDTNIYLDFYRIRNEVKTSFLEHIEAVKGNLIVTDQVEMEFKKNRQSAILEGMKELKSLPKVNVPSILKNDVSAIALEKDYKKINERIKKLKIRLDAILENPIRSDKVYQILQRLFKKKQKYDLHRNHKDRYDIRELAQKRFILGYPPRKKNDTSIGDAINWEWLIHVAKNYDVDIWIVSRDTDFGVTQNSKAFLNDWLKQEFQERINKTQKITLCQKLSTALRKFEIPITAEEEKEEERVIEAESQLRLGDSISLGDSITATVYRPCSNCGTKFEVKENEKACPSCAIN